MKMSFFQNYSKSAALLAALVLTACSGHEIGDPTEKYGDLQQLATDSTIRDTQDPTRAPRIDINLNEMPVAAAEGDTYNFTVVVRMDVGFEDVPHTLNATTNNDGVTLNPIRDKASGALTYWKVTATVADDFVQGAAEKVEVTFAVQFGSIADARKAEALRGSQPSKKQILTVERAVKKATIVDIQGNKRWQVGQIAEFDIVIDSKGVAPQWGEKTVRLKGCDEAVSSCDYADRLTRDDFVPSNNDLLVSRTYFDLTGLSLKEGEEREFVIRLVLNSPNGEKSEKTYTITAYRPEDLKSPTVEQASVPAQVAQGEDFAGSLNIELAGTVGHFADNEQAVADQLGAYWEGNIDCVADTARKEVCTFSGHFTCDEAPGSKNLQFVFSAIEGEEVKSNTPFVVPLDVLEGEACHE